MADPLLLQFERFVTLMHCYRLRWVSRESVLVRSWQQQVALSQCSNGTFDGARARMILPMGFIAATGGDINRVMLFLFSSQESSLRCCTEVREWQLVSER